MSISILAKQMIMRPVLMVSSLSKQVLRAMRLSVFLLIASAIQVDAAAYFQTFSFTGKNVPLKTVFAPIKKQTGYGFFFKNGEAMLQSYYAVTLDVKNDSLELFLKVCLNNQPFECRAKGKAIFIKKKEGVVIIVPLFATDVSKIKRRVKNSHKKLLIKANVKIKRGRHRTQRKTKKTHLDLNLYVTLLKCLSVTIALILNHLYIYQKYTKRRARKRVGAEGEKDM
ncbi:MAG TPA: hypothetical protein VF974_06955 [Patescibacteria group bacterium]